MTHTITLELSDTIIERARTAAERSGQPLEVVLSEWLEQAAVFCHHVDGVHSLIPQ